MPDTEDLYSNFRQRLTKEGSGDLPVWPEVVESKRDQVGLVLARLALSRALHTDEPISQLDREAGLWQGTAVRLYLYLTCLEMLGQLAGDSRYHSYSNWLGAKRGPSAEQRKDACQEAIREQGGAIISCESLAKALVAVHDAHLSHHGFRTNFHAFFDKCLDRNLITEIVEKCWVFEKCPEVCFAALHLVQPGYTSTNSDSPALARLADARSAWDRLDLGQRVRRIANVLEDVRNDYTHGLIPTHVPMDKEPWLVKEHSALAGSIASNKIRFVTDGEFDKLSMDTGKSGTWFGVQAIGDNDVFFVRKSGLANVKQESWVAQVLAECSRPVDRGDTIYVRHRKVALATGEMPLTQHLEKWIENGLKNAILRDNK